MLLLQHQAPRACEQSDAWHPRLLSAACSSSDARRLERARSQRLSSRAEPQFLHLAPSGDFWIGSALYAAKHNPSDYVGLPLPIGQAFGDCPPALMRRARQVDVSELRPAWSAGDPTAAVVPPGLCQLTDEFLLRPGDGLGLDDSFVVRFGLPNSSKPLNLSTYAC